MWRWLLIVASALTIFLCVNQQFVLRFFVGFTPLNTEYYYALVLVMLPFVFVIFPGQRRRAPLDRVPGMDAVLFVGDGRGVRSICCSTSARRPSSAGNSAARRMPIVWTGYLMWALLMEGLRRTGGWGLVLSVAPFTFYPLFAEARGSGRSKARNRRPSRRAPITCSRSRVSSASRSRRSPRR